MTYYLRLDDACEKHDIEKWTRIEVLLDRYNVKPLVGIIPQCEDSSMDKFSYDENFWEGVNKWINKGWTLALHGFTHVFETTDGGINPVNPRSEFAGVPLEIQKNKIKSGVKILRTHGIDPKVFFAPAHTFDMNTLEALRKESNIRIISDTVANKPYYRWGFTFIPQQAGHVRKLPFDTVTFCYHPNTMHERDFSVLEEYLSKNYSLFQEYRTEEVTRKRTLYDIALELAYFARRK